MTARRRIAESVLYGLSALFLLGLLLQFFLAGAGAFGAMSVEYHAAFGVLLVLVSFLALVVSLAGGSLRRPAALLLGIMVVQTILGGLGRDEEAWVGAFHGLNAVLVLAVAYSLLRTARERRSSS